MRKFLPYTAFFFFIFCVSCISKSSKNQEYRFNTLKEAEENFLSTLKAQDTIDVLHLGDSCLRLFQENEVENAINMIYIVENNQLMPLDQKRRASLMSRFKLFPINQHKLDYFAFSTQGHNDLKYTIESSNDGHNVAKVSFMFNPIKIGETWYLALKDGNRYSLTQREKRHPNSPAPIEVTLSSDIKK